MSEAKHYYQDNALFLDGVNLNDVANQHDTPCYVYSRSAIEEAWTEYDHAFGSAPHLVCYAVKANSNIAILNLMAKLGSGFDIVSLGELERVLAAKGDPAKVIFSGVGKKEVEIKRALEIGIKCINIESEQELYRVKDAAADMGVKAPISLRVNPNVDAKTHPYISTGLKENKFGIDIDEALRIYIDASKMDSIEVTGVDCHIGSQLTDDSPYFDAIDKLIILMDKLKDNGINLHHIDIGGGLGICYDDETPPAKGEYVKRLVAALAEQGLEIIVEPGRSIVGNAGYFLTTVEFLKSNEEKNFAIVDGAMNDLLRPSLYSAWQRIIPLKDNSQAETKVYDIVGPVCETGDFLGKERELAIEPGDILAVCSAGAYGFSMSSNYNSRPKVAEIMVDNGTSHQIRQRESITEMFAAEELLP
ncbi:MAG: diaminopimelate decarboxylase [Gammaproteobacteria bacterium]|nr:MAG: diaminopimelate decarboxylase [Gammaproteobacteria bacterium]